MSYLGKDAIYNFISSMIKGSKYCSDEMTMKILRTLIINVGYCLIMHMLMEMLKSEIIT